MSSSAPAGRAALAAIVLLAAVAPAAAQEIAIVGGTVRPVSGPPIHGATVLVRDGRIVAVGTTVEKPASARVIDATGKVVTPGLFDPWSSIGLVEVDLVGSTRDERLADEEDPITAAFDPAYGLNPGSTLIPWARTGGVTTVATGPRGGLIAGQAAVIDLAGETADEMLAEPRAAMIAALGEDGVASAGGARGGAALRLREVLEDARFWAAHRAAFDAGDSRELSESRLDLAALQPVLSGRIPLLVQVQRASDILAVLALAREYGFRPVIVGGAEAWRVAAALAADDTPVILKPLTSLPSAFERLGARFDNAALLAAAGVRVAFSTFENHRAPAIAQEAGNAVRFGLDPEAALRAVTLTPAEIYGVADRYGSIEPGKVANLVVWPGDPFDTSTLPEAVLVRGRPVPMRSRQTDLLDRYRTLDDGRPPAYRHR
ncbi:MAG TPA: amidohydrolase family protein [Candidatus Limnocylindria bacterium]